MLIGTPHLLMLGGALAYEKLAHILCKFWEIKRQRHAIHIEILVQEQVNVDLYLLVLPPESQSLCLQLAILHSLLRSLLYCNKRKNASIVTTSLKVYYL